MAYTVAKLAQLSKVSIRTLHWYDEIGLLKPAYHGSNGYRYYQEEQLLLLQQILFFKEMGFELKQIQHLLKRSDFDKIVALTSHRQVLQKNMEKTQKLIKTIENTIKHLKGKRSMKEYEMFEGFDADQQKEYEQFLIERFGEKVKKTFAECERNVKNFSKEDWELSKKEFDAICRQLAELILKLRADSTDVQQIVLRHYTWLKKFWTPTQESYLAHAQLIVESKLRQAYETYHPQLPEFLAAAIQIFSSKGWK